MIECISLLSASNSNSSCTIGTKLLIFLGLEAGGDEDQGHVEADDEDQDLEVVDEGQG